MALLGATSSRVPDAQRNYVREAVTLERLEYCILLDEDGNKRFIRGPAVVLGSSGPLTD